MATAQLEFLQRITELLPSDAIVTSSTDCANYGSDWTRTPGMPWLVVFPRATQEVSRILTWCNELEIPVVPSGGRTGLAGGCVAIQRELVLSLSKMNQLGQVDLIASTIRVESGVITQSVQDHCFEHGLFWPIDLASKGSSQIGGNLSTNAGGVRVIRYGMARKWVTSLQIVTMSGEIIELNHGLEKNNTGYDLIQLLVGSEGTLGVITAATLKLARLPKNVKVFFFPFKDIPAVLRLFERARSGPFDILAFEFFSDRCLEAVGKKLGRFSRLQTSASFYVLMEIEERSSNEASDQWLSEILSDETVTDGLLAHSSDDQKQVWGLREGITESLQLTSPIRKYDVSVPLSKMVSFLSIIDAALASLKIDLYLFGHMGDGSPHLNLLKPESATADEFDRDCALFETGLFQILKDHGGSISAEHGVGILKKHWLTFSRTPAEIRFFQGIKKAFDPKGLLNPGKVIDRLNS